MEIYRNRRCVTKTSSTEAVSETGLDKYEQRIPGLLASLRLKITFLRTGDWSSWESGPALSRLKYPWLPQDRGALLAPEFLFLFSIVWNSFEKAHFLEGCS